MTWFQNLPIARKLAMAFTVTTALTLLLGGFSLWRLNVGNDQMRDVNENWMPAVQHLGEMRAQLGEFRTFEQAQLTKQGDAAELADYDKRLADTRKLIEAEEAGYNAIPAESSPEELALYEKVEAARAAYFGAHDRIAAAIAADDFETAKANAAVEAARAGEQGRGFAVVASEVRTLAQRSANAAKEIKGLIETSVDKVADGSALVNQAGATMAEIVASVQRVTDIMAEISAASQEQSAGIEQVNQTITQMDETTQQNAALVEEASAAARSMEEQAQSLTASVSVFKLHATASAPVRKA
ncbi:MAG: hypothetical protein C0521_15945, partial [Xanthomonas sp.]|nr:hypothetical protein [Xanthomonas sp.]